MGTHTDGRRTFLSVLRVLSVGVFAPPSTAPPSFPLSFCVCAYVCARACVASLTITHTCTHTARCLSDSPHALSFQRHLPPHTHTNTHAHTHAALTHSGSLFQQKAERAPASVRQERGAARHGARPNCSAAENRHSPNMLKIARIVGVLSQRPGGKERRPRRAATPRCARHAPAVRAAWLRSDGRRNAARRRRPQRRCGLS